MKKYLLFISPCLVFGLLLRAQPPDTNTRTILFLGNSITYAGNYIADVEACYTIWHAEYNIEFINLGLPSETVSGLSEDGHAGGRFPRPDLHERLYRVLATVQPDIVFASYGMNDGIYLPFNTDRFQQYKNGMTWLHDTLAVTGARIIFITPPVYDELRAGANGYANVLDKYTDWLLAQKKTAGWEVADIHYPMKKYLDAHRKLDAAFRIDGFALANDGVHPGEAGHWLMARQLLIYLGDKKAVKYSSVKMAMAEYNSGAALLELVTERQRFMKDAWLTATGHNRPEMKAGMPLIEAKEKAAIISKRVRLLQQELKESH
ncbi:MAG: SGNH/GDSL hydrolase family protein [Chitinophagaceae bacterium]